MNIKYRLAVLFVMTAGFFWSGMGTSIRFIDDASTWQILFYRSLGLIIILLIVVSYQSSGHPVKALISTGLGGVTAAISLVLAFSGSIYAFQETSIANAAFLFATAPLITALLAWPIFNEPIYKSTLIALGLSILGILIMVSQGLSFTGFKGNIAALISALGFAGFSLSLRWGNLRNMLPAIILGGIFSAIVSGAILSLNQDGLSVSINDCLISLAMGIILLGGGMVFFSVGSKVLTATNLALLSMVEVVLAPVWAWIILREQAEFSTLLGGGILLFALILNALLGVKQSSKIH